MTLPPAASPPPQGTRVVRGGLTWPSVRGARLLRALTSGSVPDEQEQEPTVEDQFSAEFPYELELCVPTAGHLALVLVRKPPGVQLKPPARSNTTPVTHTSAAAPAAPRVVYVLDAVPPSRRGGYEDGSKSRKNKNPGVQLPPQHVDELELLQELFAPHTRAAGGKEGSVLVKAPLLCARFDCRVVSIRFIRSAGGAPKHQKLNRSGSRGLNDSTSSFHSSSGSSTWSRTVGAAAPLRCVVAREDGMAFLWEWQADLFQWVFLNRLCFLENPNLKWTRPVAAFTTTDLPLDTAMLGLSGETGSSAGSGSSGATELVWWSTATKHEPKLKLRRLRFERATDALRATDVVVGSAFTPQPACDDVIKLLNSKLGLFAISKAQGIFFRSSTASLRIVELSWQNIFSHDEGSVVPEISLMMICVHSVTGELIILHRESGAIYLVTPKSLGSSNSVEGNNISVDNESCTALVARRLTILMPWVQPGDAGKDSDLEVLDIAAHRHVFLVLAQRVLRVYALITGELLDSVDLPGSIANSSQQHGCKFWTISGGASSIGLWAPGGFWTIRLPPAKSIARTFHQSKSSVKESKLESHREKPGAAFLAMKDYGTGDSHLEAVRYALEVLEQVTPSAMDPTQSHPEAWEAVWHTVSSPALILALLDNRATSDHVVHELARHVAAIYGTASGIHSRGRLDGWGAATKAETHLLRLTPANLESLQHLANWIVLAKRKLARLEASSGTTLKECLSYESFGSPDYHSPRAASKRTTAPINEIDLTTMQADQHYNRRKDSMLDPEDARNFRLSRKLRPMSSLRFAAGCSTSSERQGQQWLLQLESFLLDGVVFKEQHRGVSRRVVKAEATPSHRLFHSERVLADFRNVAASSFSKHMYLESMSRLYLLYEPSSLLPFIRCVERFCPRIFSLSGHQPLARSHAERALTLFPPLGVFTDKVLQGKRSKDGEAAKASLLAYVDLLNYCGRHSEACRALLQCHLYEESKQRLLLLLKNSQNEQNAGDDEQELEIRTRATASSAVYFLLLEYCMQYRDAEELKVLLMLKPTQVDMLHLLRALRTTCSSISNQQQQQGRVACAGVTVGDLRAVLVALMQQRRAGVTE
ncbi:unnamed protein product [Phytophthora fragariaefolia]|uniref:Unnamed protein product n=1 Tax=Phytophthora fragariaefolia TaxID=1490495 RepID=A0A9W7DB67_9STRA|nr:unnamed protein product [Phytophthora fragariaefolia]